MRQPNVSDGRYRSPDTVGPVLVVSFAAVAVVLAMTFPVATAGALVGVVVGLLAGRRGPRPAGRTRLDGRIRPRPMN